MQTLGDTFSSTDICILSSLEVKNCQSTRNKEAGNVF